MSENKNEIPVIYPDGQSEVAKVGDDGFPSSNPPKSPPAYPVSDAQLEELEKSFTFVDLTEEQKFRQTQIMLSARVLGRAILYNVKPGQMQMEAIQLLYRAVMIANQSIQFEK